MSTRYLRGSVIHNRHDPLDKGLVGEWRFDRNTGLMIPDHSGFNRHGTITGAPWITSQIGPGLHFVNNTATYVDLDPVPLPTNFSIEFIALPTSSDPFRGICGCANTEVGEWYINVETDTAFFRDGDASSSRSIGGLSITEPAHYVWTLDVDGNHVWYVQEIGGSRDTASGNYGRTADFAGLANIGRFWDNNSYVFADDIFLFRLYSRVLTANEVGARYQLVRKRMQTFGGERRFIIPATTGEPPAGISIPVAMHHYMHKVFG